MRRRNRAYTLLEILIVLAILAAAMVGVLRLWGMTTVKAETQKEQQSVSALVDAVQGVYATAPSYEGIDMTLVAKQAALKDVLRANGLPVSAFGGGLLTLNAATIQTPNDAFAVKISQLNSRDCAAVIPALSGQTAQVSTASSGNIQTTPHVVPDGAAIAKACSGTFFQQGQGTVSLVYYRPRATGATASTGPSCATSCAPHTDSQTLNCPTGQVGHLTQTRSDTCSADACPVPVLGSWTTVSSSCAVAPTPPTPIVPIAPSNPGAACVPHVYSRTLGCPQPQVGGITQQQAITCGVGGGEIGPWTTVSSTCLAPPLPCTPGVITGQDACSGGQGGQVSWLKELRCGGGGVIIGPKKITGSSCSPACVASGTCCRPSTEPDGQKNVACSAGQYGQIVQKLEKSSTCASATAMPVWGPDVIASSTGSCAACPATTTENQTLSCPAGQVGVIAQSRSVSYACASAPTTLPAPTYSAWTTTSNTCVVAVWRPAVRRTCSFTSQAWNWSGNGQTCMGSRSSFGQYTYEEGESILIANTNAAPPGPPSYNPNTPWEGMGLAVCDTATLDAALIAHPTPAVNGVISVPTGMNPALASTSCNDPSATIPVSPISVPDQCPKDLVDSPTTNSATCAAAYATATHSNEPAGVKAFHNVTNDTCVVWNNAGTPGFSGTKFAIGCQGGSGPPTSSVPNIAW